MSSSEEVAGFQFSLDGADIRGASGGSVESNRFSIATNVDLILGYSLTANVIPAGTALLTEVSFIASADEICFEGVVISDSSSNDINSTGSNVCVAVPSCSQLGNLNDDYNGDGTPIFDVNDIQIRRVRCLNSARGCQAAVVTNDDLRLCDFRFD